MTVYTNCEWCGAATEFDTCRDSGARVLPFAPCFDVRAGIKDVDFAKKSEACFVCVKKITALFKNTPKQWFMRDDIDEDGYLKVSAILANTHAAHDDGNPF